MRQFRSAHVAAEEWRSAVEQAIEQLGDLESEGRLGFVYLTDGFAGAAGEIIDALRAATGVIHWVGTVAGGILSNGIEIYDTPALSLLVSDIDEDLFRVLPGIDRNPAAALSDISEWLKRHHPHFGVVHGDPRNPASAQLINQLAHSLEAGFLVGGVSSGSRNHFIQFADGLTEGGISGVLFSDKVPVATGLSQGCQLIGERMEITEVERNVLQRIDGRPALQVLYEAVGEEMAADPKKMEGRVFAALYLPSSDTSTYLIRNLLGLDLEHETVSIGDIPEKGSFIQFARRDETSARADLIRMVAELKGRVPNPRGGLYYSCCGRGRMLFGQDSEEMQIVREVLGDVPLTGFFANGEIHHDQLHGYSGVLTLFPSI